MSNEIIRANKKLIITLDNPNGEYLDMTAEEITQLDNLELEMKNQEKTRTDAKAEAETALANLKASAKAKLIAGEALTEDEANTIVL